MGVARVRLIVGVAVLGFVLALVLGSAGLFGGGRALGSSTTITVIGGDVSVRHGANASFVAAVDGEILNPGDAVRTGTDARAVLTYFEGSTVTVEPNTELAIDAAAAQGSDTIVQMTQTVGRTWHVVTKLVTGNSKYEVRTPASTASVRGTAFTVETDGTTTTIDTTEGTVLDQVPDPQSPGRTIDVPVRAGQQHKQEKGQAPPPTQPTPDPDRKVTITLSEQNTIVIDTLGRANGIDSNGRLLLQTPGATLTKVDGRLVITLPNIPDGRLQALVRKQGGGDVDVTTVVNDHGNSSSSNGKVSADSNSGTGHANVDIGRGNAGGNPKVDQTQAPSPSPRGTPDATPTQAAGGGGAGGGGTSGGGAASPNTGGGNAGGGTGGGGNPGGNPGGGTPGGPGQGGANPQGGGQGQGGKPTPTPGFVPPALPLAIPTSSPATNPGGQGGGGGQGSSGSQGGGGGQGSSGSQGGGGGPGSGSSNPPGNDKTPKPTK